MKKIDAAKFRSPQAIFVLYAAASCLLIMGFRFIVPGEVSPLPYFSREWRLLRGLLDVLEFFPALALSALVIPFGMIPESGELYGSFSPKFFARFNGPVTMAICSAAIYALVFFLAMPLAKDREEDLRYRAEIYRLAKDGAQTNRTSGDWLEVLQFIKIAESVWPDSPELAPLKDEAAVRQEDIYFEESAARAEAREHLEEDPRETALTGLPGQKQPLDAASAIAQGQAALADERYYDAHWLATLGTRLTRAGSIEEASARRLAGEAWNRLASLAPNSRERDRYALYRLKQSGYEAMIAGDWIRAYYLFQELVEKTPDDPDAHNFLAASENGTRETSFFIDEMELSLGHNLSGALFSLPAQSRTESRGRAVLRLASLSTTADYAYGTGLEYLSFDNAAQLLVRLDAPYVKLLPVTIEGRRKVLVLMRALDRRDENRRWEARWETGAGGSQILLDIAFEDFLILFGIRRGLSNLSMSELFTASKIFGDSGYIPQSFEVEILNRLGAVLFFLPMTIIALVAGWRYRARNRPRYLFAPMLPVLPFVFHGLLRCVHAVLGNLGVWLTLGAGFSLALVIFVAVMVVFFVLALILLAAQKDS